MQISDIILYLEEFAPLKYQESYDNCGLLTGNPQWECKGVLCTLDSIEATVDEAIHKKCNLILAHHPIIFKGLKKITGKNYVERTIIKAIKNDICIYAIHTNLDNSIEGVSKKMAEKLQLQNIEILEPKENELRLFSTYVPEDYAAAAEEALIKNGVGNIGDYSECSFKYNGLGSFKPGTKSNPKIGTKNKREYVRETKIEGLLPTHIPVDKILQDLKGIGYYEEIAYNLVPLQNANQTVGSGVLGTLTKPMQEKEFLALLKKEFRLSVIRHTRYLNKPITRVALCGGSGFFLLSAAKARQADIFITADIKYHEFFDADGQLLLADIGHYESEQFTIELLFDKIRTKFSTFAVLKTEIDTNPLIYT